jgi:hypothetical protein
MRNTSIFLTRVFAFICGRDNCDKVRLALVWSLRPQTINQGARATLPLANCDIDRYKRLEWTAWCARGVSWLSLSAERNEAAIEWRSLDLKNENKNDNRFRWNIDRIVMRCLGFPSTSLGVYELYVWTRCKIEKTFPVLEICFSWF